MLCAIIYLGAVPSLLLVLQCFSMVWCLYLNIVYPGTYVTVYDIVCISWTYYVFMCFVCCTGVLEVPTALPVPTLSQAPLTQFTQQQDHPPPVPSSQPFTVTSILAPDSQVLSQSSAQSMLKHLKRGVSKEGSSSSSATSDVMVKVDETGHSQRQVKSSRYVWWVYM